MLHWQDVYHEKVFTHMDKDNKIMIIAIDRLLADEEYKTIKAEKISVQADLAQICYTQNGAETHRINRIDAYTIITKPITIIRYEDQAELIADGNNRYCKAFLLRMRDIPGRIVMPHIWKKFRVIVPDFGVSPDEFRSALKGFSGIR